MADKIKVTINGKDYMTEPGRMILEVVREHRIDDIPTLCWDPKLPPYGSCYLCVVEVKGLEKLVPSCSSPVSEGMAVFTDNDRIRQSRKTALELLLSNHYADCLGPCKQTCPAGVDVQGYIALTAAGKYKEAVRLIKAVNPLPLVCGRVCVRECETVCRRNLVDDRVGIDFLKRYVSDIDIEDPWTPHVMPSNGKNVAIIGGGPAGLTAAYYLVLRGYGVTIFEKSPELGGMLRYGIPEYRLPKKTLDREIKWITDLGVKVETNKTMGEDFNLESLKKAGFDAIFVAIGAQKAKSMGLTGEQATVGILPGADFLHQLQGEIPKVYGRVVVVGGGNTAVDAARTSLRIGADKVAILYRRTRKEMPANEMEIEAADEEGIEMIFLSAPTGIVTKDNRLEALTCIRMELGEPDASGRRSPVPMKGSEYDLTCDFVVSAIGQDIDLGLINAGSQLAVTRQNVIVINKETFETSIPGVFAGGDAVTGPAVAIDAIAHGKIAAESIDQYVRTGKVTKPSKGFLSRKESWGDLPEVEFSHFKKIEKEKMKELPAAERIKGFAEVELGFTDGQAATEASRCLECGCSAYFDCDLRKYASQFGVDLGRFLGDVRKHRIDGAHPFIALDPNKCIACGRCVRTCSEILKIAALGFVYRGFKSIVKPSMEKKLLQTSCISCGNCIGACPTGAITEKMPFPKPGPWPYEKVESVCHFCSVGCNLSYKVFHDDLFTVANTNTASHNRGYLCAKGRWGYRYMLDKDRILKPMIRKKGVLTQVSWDEALTFAAKKMKEVLDASGPESVALFGSPRMTNEELYFLQKFARAGLKTNNVGSFNSLLNGIEQDALDEGYGITTSTTTMNELPKADVILLINADVSEENLVAELIVKYAVKKGAKLVTVSSSEIGLTRFSDLWIDSKRGTNTALVKGLSKALLDGGLTDKAFISKKTEGFKEFKEDLADLDIGGVSEVTGVEKAKLVALTDIIGKAKNLIVLYNVDSIWEKSRNDLKAIGNLMLMTGKVGKPGNGIIILRDFANSQGLIDMGVDPNYLPGNIKMDEAARIKKLGTQWKAGLKGVFKPVDLKAVMEAEKVKAFIVFGEDPINDPGNLKFMSGAEFIMVADHFMTPTALEADVVLPASLPIETDGSFTACDRRVQKITKVFEPKAGMENWQIINRLAEKMGLGLSFGSVDDIAKEIKKVIPAYKDLADGRFWGKDFLADAFPTADGKARFVAAPVEVSPMGVEKIPYLHTETYFNVKVRGKLTN